MHYFFKNSRWTAPLLILAILIIYVFSSNLTSGDSKWTLFSTMSIITEHNTDLNEYRPLFKETDFRIEKINGRYYNIFPIGPTLISVPFVWSANAILYSVPFESAFQYIKHKPVPPNAVLHYYTRVEMYSASIITALSALFLFLWLATLTDTRGAALLTLIYAFGTSAWSTASRAMWQHGPSLLCITLGLYLLGRAQSAMVSANREHASRAPRARRKTTIGALLAGAGITLGLSYLMRPTNSLVIIALTAYAVYVFRRMVWPLIAGGALVASVFTLYNIAKYGLLLPAYYLPSRLGTNAHVWEALAGNLISPARGVFVFSPILFFALAGAYIKIKEKKWNAFDTACGALIIAHWISISSFIHWWGGHSYGARFFTDMMPFFIYFLIPALAYIKRAAHTQKIIFTALFSVALIASFIIHGVGANLWSSVLWNATPISVDDKPARLWDWRDLQFLRW